MSLQRKLIRKAVVEMLVDKTVARRRVEGTRVEPYKRSELPAISVYTPDELKEDSAVRSTGELPRDLSVEISATVVLPSGPGVDVMDALDELADDIDAVMSGDVYLRNTAAKSEYSSTALAILKDADPRIAILTVTYSVSYSTTPRPPRDPADFLAADMATRLVGVADGNAVHNVIDVRATGSGGAPPDSGNGGVTRDAANEFYYPANASEWSRVLAAAGLGGGPSSVWNLQEASGPAMDAIGGIALTPANWSLWRQSVPGAARVAMRSVDGTNNCKLMNSTTAPNPATTSTLLLLYLDMPAAPPSTRFVAVAGSGCDLRYNNAGKLVLQTSATTPFPTALTPGPRWMILQCNNTARTTKAYTDQEKVVGTYAQPASAPFIALGGNNGPAGAIGYAYAAQFTGPAAELTDQQIKRLLQALGATVAWS